VLPSNTALALAVCSALIGAFGLAGPVRPDQEGAPGGAAKQPATAIQGRRLFAANCASCHGAGATCACMKAPALAGVTERMSDREIVSHARGLARRLCCARHLARVSEDDFRAIVAYLHTLKPAPAEGGPSSAPSVPGCCCGGPARRYQAP
jgi:mono/diheme cytochrome c family protein